MKEEEDTDISSLVLNNHIFVQAICKRFNLFASENRPAKGHELPEQNDDQSLHPNLPRRHKKGNYIFTYMEKYRKSFKKREGQDQGPAGMDREEGWKRRRTDEGARPS